MKWLAVVLVSFISSVLFSTSSFAETTGQLLITEVRLGGTSATTIQGESHKQFITIYNTHSSAIDISSWRLQYAKTSYSGGCNALQWSSEIALNGTIDAGAARSIEFSLTDNVSGSVRIIDSNNAVHDMVGWGDQAPCYETQSVAQIPQNDKSIVRYQGCDGDYFGADTNNNANDFISNQAPLTRLMAPDCTPVCTGDQQLIEGQCVDDHCVNIALFQATIPVGYAAIDSECHEIEPLTITEILPNVSGSDVGREFIELFNPTATSIDLKWYRIRIDDSTIAFPTGATVEAGSYVSFSDIDLGVNLLNTSSSLQIVSVNGDAVGEVVAYRNPGEDESWANIDGIWQYTTQSTPGGINQPSVVMDDKDPTTAKQCAANQYRNSETGRCRLTASVAGLATCKEGQTRNEETGRCRKMAVTAISKPCKSGQYRSEETNRCRSIAADTKGHQLCKAGQERNPNTNRCHSVNTAAMSKPGYKTEPIAETGNAFIGWWALGGAALLATGRIVWEWRSEIVSNIQRQALSLPLVNSYTKG